MTAKLSWQDIVDQNGEAIFRVAYRVLRNLHDAEDVSQEVLLEAYVMDNLPEVGLLKRMTAFRAIDRLRQRKTAICFDELVHLPKQHDLTDLSVIAEQAELLRMAIARLPQRQARCFWLRYVEGMANREIAESLSISASAVSTALSKARHSLRNSIPKKCKESYE